MPLKKLSICQQTLSPDKYFREVVDKRQICIHYTASGLDAKGVIRGWEHSEGHVCTQYVIDRDGKIYECFDHGFWGYHLGIKYVDMLPVYKKRLDKICIGIELCNWGWLDKRGNKYVTWSGKELQYKDVIALQHKDKNYFEDITDEMVSSLRELIYMLSYKNDITKEIKGDIFSYNSHALSGESGIYTHNSYRKDKYDMYPHPKLVSMLSSLYD